MVHRHSLCSVLLCYLLLLVSPLGLAADPRSTHLHQFFDAVDKDRDGQLRRQELQAYIGGLAPEYSATKIDQAVDGAIGRLDSPDQGLGVDRTELEQHLHTLLQDVKVADWVTHGLGMPQYADAFRHNSITALDLPMLVSDGGKLLQTELKVESPLHRQQLLRAMQRLLLGLGSPPGPIAQLHCTVNPAHSSDQHTGTATAATASSAGTEVPAKLAAEQSEAGSGVAAAAVACSWRPPADAGQPSMHKYVLQRSEHSASAAAWETVGELQDSLSVRYRDTPPRPGIYTYRLSAWNVYGRSPYVLSADVIVPTAQQAAAASSRSTAAAATATAASPGHPAASTAPAKDTNSCSSNLSQQGGSTCQQHQAQAAEQAANRGDGSWQGAQLNHQSPSEAALWLARLDPHHPMHPTTPATAMSKAAQKGLAASMHTAAAAVGANRHTSGAANTSGKHATTARLVALLGSAWHSSMGGWLRAVVNSFLLLVLPICVRLLPVHVLRQAAQLLAWLLQYLPAPVRQRLFFMLRHNAAHHEQHQHHLPQGQPLGVSSSATGSGSNLGGLGASTSSSSGSGRLLGHSCSVSHAGLMHGDAWQAPAAAAAGTSSVKCAGGDAALLQPGTASPAAQPIGNEVPLLPSQQNLPSPSATAADAALRSSTPASPAAGGRRAMPRSVSEFDLTRSGLSIMPALRAKSSLGGYSRSPVTTPAAGVRFASTGNSGSPAATAPAVAAAAAGSPASVYAAHNRAASMSAAVGVSQLMADTGGAAAGWRCSSAESALPWQRLSSGGSSGGMSFQGWGGAELCSDWNGPAGATVVEADERDLDYMLHGHHNDTQPKNKRCSFPGCQQQFGLRQWKATLQRHYCGRCQQAFCMQHTAYSPHGTNGTCGVQSCCLCIDCFYEFTPEYQAFLASRNTLVGKRSKSGPPAAAAAAAGAASDCEEESIARGASNRAGRVLSRLVPAALVTSSSRIGSPARARQQQGLQQQQASSATTAAQGDTAPAHAADVTAGSWSASQQQQQQQAPLARQRSLGVGATAPSAACSKGLKSKMLWERGMTKALGVVRFKAAGDRVHGSPLEAGVSAMMGVSQPGTGAVGGVGV